MPVNLFPWRAIGMTKPNNRPFLFADDDENTIVDKTGQGMPFEYSLERLIRSGLFGHLPADHTPAARGKMN
jgi:hypothetical protein